MRPSTSRVGVVGSSAAPNWGNVSAHCAMHSDFLRAAHPRHVSGSTDRNRPCSTRQHCPHVVQSQCDTSSARTCWSGRSKQSGQPRVANQTSSSPEGTTVSMNTSISCLLVVTNSSSASRGRPPRAKGPEPEDRARPFGASVDDHRSATRAGRPRHNTPAQNADRRCGIGPGLAPLLGHPTEDLRSRQGCARASRGPPGTEVGENVPAHTPLARPDASSAERQLSRSIIFGTQWVRNFDIAIHVDERALARHRRRDAASHVTHVRGGGARRFGPRRWSDHATSDQCQHRRQVARDASPGALTRQTHDQTTEPTLAPDDRLNTRQIARLRCGAWRARLPDPAPCRRARIGS
jgi:hypothetical protein